MFKYLTFSILVFSLGLLGVILNRKNLMSILISIEVMVLGVNLNYIIFSIYFDDLKGQVMFIVLLTLAAAEAAIGLSLIMLFYKKVGSIRF